MGSENIATQGLVLAKLKVGKKDSSALYAQEDSKTAAIVDAKVKSKKSTKITGTMGGFVKIRKTAGDVGAMKSGTFETTFIDSGAFAYSVAGVAAAITAIAF